MSGALIKKILYLRDRFQPQYFSRLPNPVRTIVGGAFRCWDRWRNKSKSVHPWHDKVRHNDIGVKGSKLLNGVLAVSSRERHNAEGGEHLREVRPLILFVVYYQGASAEVADGTLLMRTPFFRHRGVPRSRKTSLVRS